MSINYFTNNRFRVLFCLCESMDSNCCARISQQEVAERLNLSRMTVNTIFKQLREDGFIEQDSIRPMNNVVTQKAISIIDVFKQMNKKDGEDN